MPCGTDTLAVAVRQDCGGDCTEHRRPYIWQQAPQGQAWGGWAWQGRREQAAQAHERKNSAQLQREPIRVGKLGYNHGFASEVFHPVPCALGHQEKTSKAASKKLLILFLALIFVAYNLVSVGM
jgi:hypothetical protein